MMRYLYFQYFKISMMYYYIEYSLYTYFRGLIKIFLLNKLQRNSCINVCNVILLTYMNFSHVKSTKFILIRILLFYMDYNSYLLTFVIYAHQTKITF